MKENEIVLNIFLEKTMNFFSERPVSVFYVADKLFWVSRKKGGYAWHVTFRHVEYRAERGELVWWMVPHYVWPCQCSEIKISMTQCFLLQLRSISAAQETFRWQPVDCTVYQQSSWIPSSPTSAFTRQTKFLWNWEDLHSLQRLLQWWQPSLKLLPLTCRAAEDTAAPFGASG